MRHPILNALIFLCDLSAFSPCAAETGEVIRAAVELAAATYDRAEVGRTFALSGRLVTECSPGVEASFSFQDDSGYMILRKERVSWTNLAVAAGTRVMVAGRIDLGRRSRRAYARCQTLEVVSAGPPPEPVAISSAEFFSGWFDCQLVRMRGVIRDIVSDEVDPDYSYLILNVDGANVFAPILAVRLPQAGLAIGSIIEAVGVCSPTMLGARRQIGRHLAIGPDGLRILMNTAQDPFLALKLEGFGRLGPQEIASLGRRRATGRVLAVWQGRHALLRGDDGQAFGLETSGGALPRPGDAVEAVGFPESDLYRVNLVRAIWRRLPKPAVTGDAPASVAAEDLLTDAVGRRRFDPYAHGRVIRLRGVVRNLPGDGNEDGRFNIESGAFIVPVDVSETPHAIRGLSVGCEIAVSGVCVTDIDNWSPNAPFPTIRGFSVVVRDPSDIVVVRRPSWWTPRLLATIIGLLFAFLVVSLVLNAILRRLAERRGRELADSAIAKAEADLKVYERTRLAVELHDAVSQNLTCVSLAIRAADRHAADIPSPGLRTSLDLATRTLGSCRAELQNCLWDLRNLTLDETDLNDAIRRTLAPHLGDAGLTVRFNVPRERLSDKTAHAILRILRELATNAVRHGHATQVRIAGLIEGERMTFSVQDNGCGFSPGRAPGMDEGHFGLQGIRERINSFEGDMRIESAAGRGTKVTLSLHIPQETTT